MMTSVHFHSLLVFCISLVNMYNFFILTAFTLPNVCRVVAVLFLNVSMGSLQLQLKTQLHEHSHLHLHLHLNLQLH